MSSSSSESRAEGRRGGNGDKELGDDDFGSHSDVGEQEQGLALASDLGGLSLRHDVERGGFAVLGGAGGMIPGGQVGAGVTGGGGGNLGFCAGGFGLLSWHGVEARESLFPALAYGTIGVVLGLPWSGGGIHEGSLVGSGEIGVCGMMVCCGNGGSVGGLGVIGFREVAWNVEWEPGDGGGGRWCGIMNGVAKDDSGCDFVCCQKLKKRAAEDMETTPDEEEGGNPFRFQG